MHTACDITLTSNLPNSTNTNLQSASNSLPYSSINQAASRFRYLLVLIVWPGGPQDRSRFLCSQASTALVLSSLRFRSALTLSLFHSRAFARFSCFSLCFGTTLTLSLLHCYFAISLLLLRSRATSSSLAYSCTILLSLS